MKKKLLALLLCLALISGSLPAVSAAGVGMDKTKTYRVLIIGNSYSMNVSQYLTRMVKNLGYDISVTTLYYPGCTLQQHCNFIDNDSASYAFYVDAGKLQWGKTMKDALKKETYDLISFQQSPSGCEDYSTYYTPEHPYLTKLADYCRSFQPTAKFVINQTWAFCDTKAASKGYTSSHAMFEDVRENYKKASELLGGLDIIPVGEAVQLAIDQFGFSDRLGETLSVHADEICHLTPFGCYLGAAVWSEYLTGEDCRNITFVPDGSFVGGEDAETALDPAVCKTLREVAHEAVSGETSNVYDGLRVVENGDGYKLVHYGLTPDSKGTITVPAMVNGKPLNGIAEKAFWYNDGIIRTIVLPRNAKSWDIEDGALTFEQPVEELYNTLTYDTALADNSSGYFGEWWNTFQNDASINDRTKNGNALYYGDTWVYGGSYPKNVLFGDMDHTGNGGHSIKVAATYNSSSNQVVHLFPKFARLFGEDKKTFTAEDCGKTFRISFWVYVEQTTGTSFPLEYGISPIGSRNDHNGDGGCSYGEGPSYQKSFPKGSWQQASFVVKLTEKMVGLSQIGLLYTYSYDYASKTGDGSDALVYYIDDVEVTEIGNVVPTVQYGPMDREKTYKVLIIGNSYSMNVSQYLTRMVQNLGYQIQVTTLYYPGCTLRQHCAFIDENKDAYAFYVDAGKLQWGKTMEDALTKDTYDLISFQQSPDGCEDFSTYYTPENPYLTKLADYCRSFQPTAQFVIHQTWAFHEGKAAARGYTSSHAMFEDVRECYENAAALLGGLDIVPVGEAVQLAIDQYGFSDKLNEGLSLHADDICHLSPIGCYLGACVWSEYLTGDDCRNITFVPDGTSIGGETAEVALDPAVCKILRDVAHEVMSGEATDVYNGLRVVENGDGYKLMHCGLTPNSKGTITVPETINGKPINAIDKKAFLYSREVIRKIILPESAVSWDIDDGALTFEQPTEYTVNTLTYDTALADNSTSYFRDWWTAYQYDASIQSRTTAGNALYYGDTWVYGGSYPKNVSFGNMDHTGNGGHSIQVQASYNTGTNQVEHLFPKFARLFGEDKRTFSAEDCGRTFRISFWVYVDQTTGNSYPLEYGMCPIGSRNDYNGDGGCSYGEGPSYQKSFPKGSWQQASFVVTLDEKMVGLSQIGLLYFYSYDYASKTGDGSDALRYYIDDIEVTEIGSVVPRVQYGAVDPNATYKVLIIGNSYSINASQYTSRIAASLGKKVSVNALYYPGCTLKQHYDYFTGNKANYAFCIDGGPLQWGKTMEDALLYDEYDLITFQQSPDGCDNFSTYYTETTPYLTALRDYVVSYQPDAKLMINQTWGFCNPRAKEEGYEDCHAMFEKVRQCYEKAAELLGDLEIIPVGEAVQLAIDQYGFTDELDTDRSLHNDTISHLNHLGRYLASCVWTETLFGVDCREAAYVPDGTGGNSDVPEVALDADLCAILRQVAHQVVSGEEGCVYGDFRAIPVDGGMEVTGYIGTPDDGVITVPDTFDGKPVVGVARYTFAHLNGLKEISLPGTVKNVPAGALDLKDSSGLSINALTYDKKVDSGFFMDWWNLIECDTTSKNDRQQNGNWLYDGTVGVYGGAWPAKNAFGTPDHTGNGGNSIRLTASYNTSTKAIGHTFIKFAHLFGDQKKLTAADVGRTFKVSFWVYTESAPSTTLRMQYGLCAVGSRSATADSPACGYSFYSGVPAAWKTLSVGMWEEITFTFTVDETMAGPNQCALFGIYTDDLTGKADDGSDNVIYCVDDITLTEVFDRSVTVTWRQETTLHGDADGNGTLDTADLLLVKKCLAGLVDQKDLHGACDYNEDGVLDTADLSLLKKKLAGLI